jgi:hypothetical protein
MGCEDMNWIEMALARIQYGGVPSGSIKEGTSLHAFNCSTISQFHVHCILFVLKCIV